MCRQSKQNGLNAAMQYYKADLPQRIAGEKRTLAQLTGWSMVDIDAMPGARRFAVLDASKVNETASQSQFWWQKLFSNP